MGAQNNQKLFIDTAVLERLTAFHLDGSSENTGAEIVALFLAVAPKLIFELHDLWKAGDWAGLEERAERFQLSCEAVGAKSMGEMCLLIRSAAGQSPEELKPLIEDLSAVYTCVALELEAWIRRLPCLAAFPLL